MSREFGHRTLSDGTTLCAHDLETCHTCCMDFSTMNQEARQQIRLEKVRKNAEKNGPQDIRDESGAILSRGTWVRLENRSGNGDPFLDQKILGIERNDSNDEDDQYSGMTCYVLEEKQSKDLSTYPVEWVHDEYQVECSGKFFKVIDYLSFMKKAIPNQAK